MTVFVPVTGTIAHRLRTGSALDLLGYADGPALRSWLGDGQLSEEEVGYVALNNAGVAALLLDDPTRIILAVDRDLAGDDELGTVTLPAVRWAEVQSLFGDAAAAAESVAAARAAIGGLDLGAALASPVVDELQRDHDLLWYGPEELDTLTDRS
ncbi:MAG TPA: hypothetical protein VFU98_10050 [Microlunatus sp.]|nr:hypothetical protein [Microlunatus sp.]